MPLFTPGTLLVSFFVLFFVYYTLWVIVLPFVDKDYKTFVEQ